METSAQSPFLPATLPSAFSPGSFPPSAPLSSTAFPADDYVAQEFVTSTGELVPQPGVDPRFDAARHHGYETMPTSMGLLLNHRAGGEWNTTTVNELTVVPSEDVESCIRGLHINGALVRPLQRGTLVRAWRSLMTAAGVDPPALGAPLPLSAPAPSPPTPSLPVGPRSEAGRGKRTASDARWLEEEEEEARTRAFRRVMKRKRVLLRLGVCLAKEVPVCVSIRRCSRGLCWC